MKVKTLSLAQIKPYWRNPRKNDAAVEAVKASILRYGFNVPIVVDEGHEIVAGHTRYKALQQLGVEKVACVVLTGVPPEKIREYRIADNKSSELAEWDMANLIPELRSLPDPEAMQPFFGDVDLEALLSETAGSGFKPPEQGAIDKLQDQMDTRFADQSLRTQADYIDFPCPHCGEFVTLSAEDIQRQLKIKAEARA